MKEIQISADPQQIQQAKREYERAQEQLQKKLLYNENQKNQNQILWQNIQELNKSLKELQDEYQNLQQYKKSEAELEQEVEQLR